MDWYLKVLKNYVGFRGRARRKEYWMFILVNIIFTFVLGLLDKMLGWQRAGGEGILTTIYGILVFLPWWAVQFRRLHDTDRSALMNPLMILVKIIKLRWIHILSYDQMVSRKINNQTTRCANSIFYTTLFTNSAPNYT
ncbi:DUF805 domain-containing protein [Escherichia coli]|nr:DUF805 domain-containing protein [Escherichia coli]